MSKVFVYVLSSFHDRNLGGSHRRGDEFECTLQQGQALAKAGLAVIKQETPLNKMSPDPRNKMAPPSQGKSRAAGVGQLQSSSQAAPPSASKTAKPSAAGVTGMQPPPDHQEIPGKKQKPAPEPKTKGVKKQGKVKLRTVIEDPNPPFAE